MVAANLPDCAGVGMGLERPKSPIPSGHYLACAVVSWKSPLTNLTLSLPTANSLPREFDQNNQKSLFNVKASWGFQQLSKTFSGRKSWQTMSRAFPGVGGHVYVWLRVSWYVWLPAHVERPAKTLSSRLYAEAGVWVRTKLPATWLLVGNISQHTPTHTPHTYMHTLAHKHTRIHNFKIYHKRENNQTHLEHWTFCKTIKKNSFKKSIPWKMFST